jgi:predicted Zn finger-like uncharacterized protein
MLIVCPNCSTSYQVKSEALGQSGRKVRCARCRREWFATPSAIPLPPGEMPVVTSPPTQAGAIEHGEAEAAPAAPAMAWDAGPSPEASQPASAPDAGAPAPAGEVAADATVAPAPVPEPPTPAATAAAETAAAPVGTDIESMAARRYGAVGRALRHRLPTLARLRGGRGRIFALPILPTLIGVQLLAIVAIVWWRNEVVRALPPTASLFRLIGLPPNLRGLAFADLRAASETHDGVAVLVIEGTIENVTGSAVTVPRLRFALRNGARAELISWTAPPEQGTLGAGAALPFRSRLAAPPADGNDVLVRFLTRADLNNGAR